MFLGIILITLSEVEISAYLLRDSGELCLLCLLPQMLMV